MPKPIYQFVQQMFSQSQPPQTALISVSGYDITIQYIPQEGFVVGYQDKRIKKVSYTMLWADIIFEKSSQKKLGAMTPDQLREYVMNSTELLEKEGLLLEPPSESTQLLLPDGTQRQIVVQEKEMSAPVDIPSSISELVQTIEQVAESAAEIYQMNSIMYLNPKRTK